jgi:Ca-activated chloride channel family protein
MLERVVSLGLFLTLLSGSAAGAETSVGSGSVSAENQTGMTIRKSVQEVRVEFHLASQNGRPVSGLQKDQLSVYEDGRPVAGITGFYMDDNLPLRLLLMIDASDSMTKGFALERAAAGTFLRRVARPGVDESAVVVFSTRTEMDLGGDASSPETLRKIGLLHSAGLTALFDSICKTAELLSAHDGERTPTRRVLVLLSDGDDTYSLRSLNDAIAAAQRSDLVIYAVTAHDSRDTQLGDSNLAKLTEATGGRVFFLKKDEQSERVFAEIEQEIRAQYTVTFRPAGDACGFHNVRVEAADRSLRTRSRAGFYGDCL